MTRHTTFRALRALGCVALVVSASLLPASSASANHQNFNHHWGKQYRPLVATDCGAFGGQMCQWTGEAENLWVANGFNNGFRANNPNQSCSQLVGWITVCVVARFQLPPDADGVTSPTFVVDPHFHMRTAVIKICGDCGLSQSRLRTAIQHEYGHAIGLGHSIPSEGTSVMLERGAPPGNVSDHDRHALRVMYPRHPEFDHDSTMYQGEAMYSSNNSSLLSNIRASEFVLQASDGNLVVYDRYYNRTTWSSGTTGTQLRFQMQNDGNAVLVRTSGQPICSTRTSRPGSWMIMQDDGNLVVYAPGGEPQWNIFAGGQCYPA